MKPSWACTAMSPFSRKSGYFAGERGWRNHVVFADPAESFVALGRRKSLCGLVPLWGWAGDMFDLDKCERCLKAAAKQGIDLTPPKMCAQCYRVEVGDDVLCCPKCKVMLQAEADAADLDTELRHDD